MGRAIGLVDDLMRAIVGAADATGFPLSRLALEITETRLMPDRLISLDIVTRLRLKRVSLCIDDFGTSHASLAHLRDIPFDELKGGRFQRLFLKETITCGHDYR